jgi:hypothetical protein
LANISYRLRSRSAVEAIRATIRADRVLSDAFDRCRKYLLENGVDLAVTLATLGPWVTFDPNRERFVDGFSHPPNVLARRDYRKPIVVPKIT